MEKNRHICWGNKNLLLSMKKIVITTLLLHVAIVSICQRASGKLTLEQGKVYEVTVNTNVAIAQQAMGQAIDFHVNGNAIHSYKVTNSTPENSTLHHDMNKITFAFDGMGMKMNFDSDNPKDMEGRMGKPIKEILSKKYDMVVDANGKVLLAQPEKFDMPPGDDRLRLVTDMLKELTSVVHPPKKGEGSFFRVLPENEAAIGDTWSEKGLSDGGEYSNTYTLAEITDTTIIVNFNGTSSGVTKADFGGTETTTTMSHKITGTIIVDKATGIVRQKKFNTESSGSTDFMGNSLPLTSRTTTVMDVRVK
jgi:hypothetical protein